MITVTLLRAGGRIQGFTCSGHAGYGTAGKDIVCSAVSALTQTCLIGLTQVANIQAGVSISETDGIACILEADMPEEQAQKAQLLLETLEAGLRSIDEAYPKTLKIRSREV